MACTMELVFTLLNLEVFKNIYFFFLNAFMCFLDLLVSQEFRSVASSSGLLRV